MSALALIMWPKLTGLQQILAPVVAEYQKRQAAAAACSFGPPAGWFPDLAPREQG